MKNIAKSIAISLTLLTVSGLSFASNDISPNDNNSGWQVISSNKTVCFNRHGKKVAMHQLIGEQRENGCFNVQKNKFSKEMRLVSRDNSRILLVHQHGLLAKH